MLSLLADEIAERLFDASRLFLPINSAGALETWAGLPAIDKANYRRRAEQSVIDLEPQTARLARKRTAANVSSKLIYDYGEDYPEMPEGFLPEAIESALQHYPFELGICWAHATKPSTFPRGVAGKCSRCGDVMWGEADGSAACLNCGHRKETR
jgi:hypothetical protein